MNYKYIFIILIVISIFINFYSLTSDPLVEDESIHTLLSIEIKEKSSFLNYYYYNTQYDEKTPLKFWLNGLTFMFFGVSKFTIRFWSGFFGVLIIFLTYLLGKELFNKEIGIYAGLILITSWIFVFNHNLRGNFVEPIFIFFFLLSILFFINIGCFSYLY